MRRSWSQCIDPEFSFQKIPMFTTFIVNGWSTRPLWSYRARALDNFKLATRTSCEFVPYENFTNQELVKTSRTCLAMTPLFTCFQLHPNCTIKKGKWDSKLSQNERERKIDCIHIQSPTSSNLGINLSSNSTAKLQELQVVGPEELGRAAKETYDDLEVVCFGAVGSSRCVAVGRLLVNGHGGRRNAGVEHGGERVGERCHLSRVRRKPSKKKSNL